MENISEHISYEEAVISQTAQRKGIDNTPSPEILENMKSWAENIFEPLRKLVSEKRGVDSPLHISSFYRCPALNEAVGGADSSQHTMGQAGDIECYYPGFTKADLFKLVKESSLPFDQMIWEFGDDNQPAWVHVSYSPRNRREIIKAIVVNGKTEYTACK